MTLLRAAFPYLVAVAAAVFLFWFVYEFGVHVEHQARVAEVSQLKADHAVEQEQAQRAVADAQQAARDIEAKRAADMAALDAQHTEEMNNAKAISDRTIADLRAGAIRVRERFTCPASKPASASTQAGTSTSVGDAGQANGLQNEDVAILLREAERADEVTVMLRACQGIVRGDRKGQ